MSPPSGSQQGGWWILVHGASLQDGGRAGGCLVFLHLLTGGVFSSPSAVPIPLDRSFRAEAFTACTALRAASSVLPVAVHTGHHAGRASYTDSTAYISALQGINDRSDESSLVDLPLADCRPIISTLGIDVPLHILFFWRSGVWAVRA